MIRFVIATTVDTTEQVRVDGEITDVIRPAGTILRSGFCNEAMFNRQALGAGEMAVEIDAANWPVNDVTHRIDVSGEEPALVLI